MAIHTYIHTLDVSDLLFGSFTELPLNCSMVMPIPQVLLDLWRILLGEVGLGVLEVSGTSLDAA